MAKSREIRDLTDSQILEEIDKAKQEMFNLRFQSSTGQLENPQRIKLVQRDIARYKTILRERELAQQLVQQEGKEN
ncbi:MAG: 50S ribosomal protein L29 [Chloroflexota bacterium]|nr:50S ribosomal protein L29 [Chloroflexota bacterium]NOG62784.1 50S ribosomal protein L29 [Chloroflexota bacterium]GIK63008.1 MAG: 50S ribosomal protein L29 [Chloroflexota bacterium]